MNASEISYDAVRDIFAAMRLEQIEGFALSDVIGGGDPEFVAAEVVSLISSHDNLKARRSILDVGCGCGRIAAALTQHVNPATQYVGVDIVPGLVDFGRRFITARYPEFKFLLLDEGNVTYDAWRAKPGEADILKLSEAMPPASADLAISVSLFTHLDFAPAVEVLSVIYDLLAPGSRAFVTIFILNEEAKDCIRTGRTGFSFKHRTPGGRLYAEKLEDPTYAVAYDWSEVEQLVASSGFTLERCITGYWTYGGPGEIFQDALILRKDGL